MYLGCTFVIKFSQALREALEVAIALDTLKVTIESSSSCQQVEKLTGSTADTFLEYIQRNLPEGVAMKVTKVCDYFFHFIKANYALV